MITKKILRLKISDFIEKDFETDIMDFLMEQVILKLKCDNDMHDLIKEKIIGSITFYVGNSACGLADRECRQTPANTFVYIH